MGEGTHSFEPEATPMSSFLQLTAPDTWSSLPPAVLRRL